MESEVKRLIRGRSAKKARFRRDGAGKKPQLSDSWRRPRGLHHKQRRQKKAKGALPTPGYGSPILVRGVQPCGLRSVRIFRVSELTGLDPASSAVLIAGTVGNKNRAAIQEEALKAGLRVLNPKGTTVPETGNNVEAGSDE